jgi:hypothetical protein
LLVALGAASDAYDVIAIDGGMTYGVLSMDSFAWGVGTFSRAHRSRVGQVADAKDLSDDAVAAICHPLPFYSPQVPL